METGIIYQHRISGVQLGADIQEVYRYAGYTKAALLRSDKTVPEETAALAARCIAEMQPVLHPQAVYASFPLEIASDKTHPDTCTFAGYSVKSAYLSRNLRGCTRVILLAATIGPQADLLIRRAAKLDSARGAVMQAAGAMFTESYVDLLNRDLSVLAAAGGFKLKPRYSPGYGDVPLSVQSVFFSLLQCARKIGLTLTASFVMAPEKSVTAFIGMEPISD